MLPARSAPTAHLDLFALVRDESIYTTVQVCLSTGVRLAEAIGDRETSLKLLRAKTKPAAVHTGWMQLVASDA